MGASVWLRERDNKCNSTRRTRRQRRLETFFRLYACSLTPYVERDLYALQSACPDPIGSDYVQSDPRVHHHHHHTTSGSAPLGRGSATTLDSRCTHDCGGASGTATPIRRPAWLLGAGLSSGLPQQQRLRVLQAWHIKAFRKPAVDRREQILCVRASALVVPKAGAAWPNGPAGVPAGGASLPGLRTTATAGGAGR
jgi:hypothetical protein